MSTFDKNDPQTSFGAFKPVGNLVIVSPSGVAAVATKNELQAIGHESEEITVMDGSELVAMLDELAEDQSDLAMLGSELRKTDEFRKHAEKGASFLIVNAPDKDTTDKVIEVVDSVGYLYALKYGSFIIERFEPNSQ